MKKRLFTVLAALVMAVLFAAGCGKAQATTMRICFYSGDVRLSNSGNESAIKEDLRLKNGDVLDTMSQSLAKVSLDDSKLVSMDQNSSTEYKQNGKKLELYVKSGAVFFNVMKPLTDDESFEIRTSTMITGIRGTSGVVRTSDTGDSVIITDGSAVVKGINPETGEEAEQVVSAGEKLTVIIHREAENGSVEFKLQKIEPGDLDGFAIDAINEDPDLLLRVLNDTRWSFFPSRMNGAGGEPSGMEGDPRDEGIVIEGKVEDGIQLMAYYSFDPSDTDKAILDSIIDACEKTNEKDAAYMLPDKAFVNMSESAVSACKRYMESDSEYRFVYRGYKVCGQCMDSQKCLYLIPVEDGTGYLIGFVDRSYSGSIFDPDLTYTYGHCECKNGMFNGSFYVEEWRELPYESDPSTLYHHITGSVINGFMDGETLEEGTTWSIQCEPNPIRSFSTFSMGEPLVKGTTEDGEDAYSEVYYYDVTGEPKLSTSCLGWSWTPGCRVILSAYSGSISLGMQDDALFTYPY